MNTLISIDGRWETYDRNHLPLLPKTPVPRVPNIMRPIVFRVYYDVLLGTSETCQFESCRAVVCPTNLAIFRDGRLAFTVVALGLPKRVKLILWFIVVRRPFLDVPDLRLFRCR